MRRFTSLNSPYLYALIIVNALIVAFIADTAHRIILSSAHRYYARQDTLYLEYLNQ